MKMVNKALTRIDTNQQQNKLQQNPKIARKNSKNLQPVATDKENLAGRLIPTKEAECEPHIDAVKRRKVEEKSVQAGEGTITADDLVSNELGGDFWKALALQREKELHDSYRERERLNEKREALEDAVQIRKGMLEDARKLVEMLKEMLNEGEEDNTEPSRDATEEATGQSI